MCWAEEGIGEWCSWRWCGVVWRGVVWCGVVWCGVVWCSVVDDDDVTVVFLCRVGELL